MDRQYIVMAGMAFELVGLVWALVVVGQYFDEKNGWPGYGLAAGAFIGFAAWILHMFTVMRALAKDPENEDTKGQ